VRLSRKGIGPGPGTRYNTLEMYEHKTDALLPLRRFLYRLLGHGAAGLAAILVSLGIGVLGYHHFERFSWLDSLLNASMILGGMGPVNPVLTAGGKVFASCYALFSGVVFLVVVGVMMAPVAHRLFHRLHLEAHGEKDAD
jgi:hypothetical protein